MEILDKIYEKLESVDDKVGNLATAQSVMQEKFIGLQVQMDEGRKRNIEAQGALSAQVEKLAPRIDGKADEAECRSRYESLKTEIKKYKKAIFLIFLLLGGGAFTTAMTPEGKGIIKQLLTLLMGML